VRRPAILVVLCALVAGCAASYQFDENSLDAGAPGSTGDAATPGNGCASDVDCPSVLHCDVGSSSCVECLGDDQCTESGSPHCDDALHRCVECDADAHCGAGRACQLDIRRCVTPCSTSAESVCEGLGECDEARGFCTACDSEHACAAGQICDSRAGQCVACLLDSDCAAPTAYCDRAHGRCVGCLAPGQCPVALPWCEPTTGACIAR
jgi:Cys-rich repeat protein